MAKQIKITKWLHEGFADVLCVPALASMCNDAAEKIAGTANTNLIAAATALHSDGSVTDVLKDGYETKPSKVVYAYGSNRQMAVVYAKGTLARQAESEYKALSAAVFGI